MVKFTILLRRNPALTHEQFVAHHKDVHASLFMSIPAVKENVRRYIQQHATDVELPGLPPRNYDGITELWFDTVDAVGSVFSDSDYLRLVRPDEETFLDLQGCDFMISQETVVSA